MGVFELPKLMMYTIATNYTNLHELLLWLWRKRFITVLYCYKDAKAKSLSLEGEAFWGHEDSFFVDVDIEFDGGGLAWPGEFVDVEEAGAHFGFFGGEGATAFCLFIGDWFSFWAGEGV